MQDGLGLREFGRLIGVSGEAVRKAIKTGRIPRSMVGEKLLKSGRGVPTISDPAGARAAFEANTSPNYRQDGAKISAGRKAAAPRSAPVLAAQQAREAPAPPASPRGAPSITDSRAITEAYKARLAKLEYEERSGKLVNADDFKVRYSKLVTTARTHMLAVPSKAKGKIPHLTIDEIQVLDKLIREALRDVAGGR